MNQTQFTLDARSLSVDSRDWGFGGVEVIIPEDMKVATNPNIRVPAPDLLNWWEGPYGDRKAQVQLLLQEAVERGSKPVLTGSTPVVFRLRVNRFHALTPLARATNIQLGVHSLNFDFAIIDIATEQLLAEQERIDADINAYSGSVALLSELRGESQKSRIQDQVALVVQSWLTAITSVAR